MPPRKTRRVKTVTQEQEETTKYDLPALLKAYYNDGAEYVERLKEAQYTIKVYRYNKEGRAVQLVGRVWENPETLMMDLGAHYGSGRYKVYITCREMDDSFAGLCRLEDYQLEYIGENDPPVQGEGDAADDEDDTAAVDQGRDYAAELQILQIKQQHEIQIEQIKANNAVMIALAQAKGGGGVKAGDMIELIKLGAAMGQGVIPGGDGDGGDGGGADYLTSLINSPLAAALAGAILKGKSEPPAPAQPKPPAQAIELAQ